MTVLEVIQRSTEYLSRKTVDSPRLQVELLLAQVLNIPRLQLYLNYERVLNAIELDRIRQSVMRRGRREPLQHILGSTSFCGLEMKVTPAVLIPRPETELLAEKAWFHLNQSATPGHTLQVLDWGTGSGCLAIAIAVRCPQAQVHALDISCAALDVARENAANHAVSSRIAFYAGDGFQAIPQDSRFDLIVSNPPYIPTSQIGTLAPEVRLYDPHQALDGGPQGLDFYRRLANEAPAFLGSDGCLMLEIGDQQEGSIGGLLNQTGWTLMFVELDYNKKPRIIGARRAGHS